MGEKVDWDCELHTFSVKSMWMFILRFIGAMDWVFDNEEQAIILEDDCVPSVAFLSIVIFP